MEFYRNNEFITQPNIYYTMFFVGTFISVSLHG